MLVYSVETLDTDWIFRSHFQEEVVVVLFPLSSFFNKMRLAWAIDIREMPLAMTISIDIKSHLCDISYLFARTFPDVFIANLLQITFYWFSKGTDADFFFLWLMSFYKMYLALHTSIFSFSLLAQNYKMPWYMVAGKAFTLSFSSIYSMCCFSFSLTDSWH